MFSGFSRDVEQPPTAEPPQGGAESGFLGGLLGSVGLGSLVASAPAQDAPAAPPQPPPQQPREANSRAGVTAGMIRSTGLEPLLGDRGPAAPATAPKRISADERMGRYIEAAAALSEEKAPQCAAALRAMKPAFALLLHVAILVGMGYARLYGHLYEVYKSLPLKELEMVAGLILCFFGGTYVTLIAAFEAFRTMGGQSLYEDLTFVATQVKTISDAQARDSLVDEDRDGIADVDQITPEELTQRKLKVAMVAVDDPSKLQTAVGNLWAACLAVLATLKLQFAQTAAYALAIAEMVKFPVLRAAAPTVTWGLGKDLTHWVDPVIDSTLKVICILLVWYLAKIRAAFYSGMRGGRMFAEAAISFCDQRGWMNKVPDFIAKKPFNPEDSYLDEAVGFVVAAIGFYWQVSSSFFLPFPLDWLLWPVTMAEYFLEVQVSWS